MITLIVVDCQYDFIKGSLAVRGANKVIDNIIAYIFDNKDAIDKVVFTLDWHPVNHCSFEKNGGQWPVHCVQYSKGASIDDRLLEAVIDAGINYDIIIKGDDAAQEEYGAFSIPPFSDCLFDRHHTVNIDKHSDIVVCGIAGDYCVKETTLNLIELNPKMFLKGVASIDDGTTVNDFIEGFKIDVVE